jgi:hypothetical protein
MTFMQRGTRCDLDHWLLRIVRSSSRAIVRNGGGHREDAVVGLAELAGDLRVLDAQTPQPLIWLARRCMSSSVRCEMRAWLIALFIACNASIAPGTANAGLAIRGSRVFVSMVSSLVCSVTRRGVGGSPS